MPICDYLCLSAEKSRAAWPFGARIYNFTATRSAPASTTLQQRGQRPHLQLCSNAIDARIYNFTAAPQLRGGVTAPAL